MGISALPVPGGLTGSGTFGTARYRLAVAGVLVLSLTLLGGASRADEFAQLPLRLVAVGVLAASLWPLEVSMLRANLRVLAFALACAALPLIQLIPLPPGMWSALPGHEAYARIAEATGTVGWRPLSLTPDLTVNAFEALLVPAAALAAALHLDAGGRKAMALAFVAAATFSALLGLAQLAVPEPQWRFFAHFSENAPVGLFANRNHQAALLACALPLGAAVIPARGSRQARLLVTAGSLSAATLLTAVLLLTGSRMGVLLWAGGVLGGAWILHARGLLRVPHDRATLAGWFAALAAAALLAGALLAQGEALERFTSADIAADIRSAALPSLLATARAFFPLGAGFGSFDSVYRQFEPDARLSTIYLNQAHNEPLQLAIEGGLPALVLLLVFALWWARTAWRLLRRNGHGARRGLPRAAVVVSGLLLASSLVDYPLRVPLLAALFAVCCAELAIAGRRQASEARAE